jgi:hypothetical protein
LKTALIILAALTLTAQSAQAAEPRTCSEARELCHKPMGRHCDAGCRTTCHIRFNGCLKTGAFSAPGKLLQSLKRI